MQKYREHENIRTKLLQLIAVLFPYLIILAIIAGLVFTFVTNRLDFAVKGILMIAIPAFLASFLLLRLYKENFDFKNSAITFTLNQRSLILLFGILFTISICILLASPYRPWYYFVVISALYVLVFIQIFSKNAISVPILLEIIFIMINLIYGVTLKYPFYFGHTDINAHIFFSEVTYLSGHIIPEDLSLGYTYFPLYHILIAESSYLIGLDIKTSLFVVTCIPYVMTVFFIYYSFNRIIQNKQISLLTCLLYSTSSTVIFYGFYMITRTMAFVGFIVLLYLFYKGAEDKRNKIIYRALAILMAIFLILIHQVSIVQIVILLSTLFVCEWIVNDKRYLSHNFFMLLNVMFLGYWIHIAWLFATRAIESRIQPHYFEHIILAPTTQYENVWTIIRTYTNLYILIFFTLIGIGYVLWRGKPKYTSVFGLFAMMLLVLYIPNPLHVLWQTMTLFRFDRFMLLLSPFMALVMGWGVYVFYNYLLKRNIPKKICSMIIILLVVGFVFTSLVPQDCASDCKDLPWKTHRQYFNHKELQGFNYIFDHVPFGSRLYSDYYAWRYFVQVEFNETDELNLPFYVGTGIHHVEDLPKYKGYIIIRDEEYSDVGLFFDVGFKIPQYLHTPIDENRQRLYNHLQKKDKIYSNYAVDIYYSCPEVDNHN